MDLIDFLFYQCKSGECLQRNLVCNNIMDCEDGSDEQSCGLYLCSRMFNFNFLLFIILRVMVRF